jgi:hypothetical protein
MKLYILFALISLTQSMHIFTHFLSIIKKESIKVKEVEKMREKRYTPAELSERKYERREKEMMVLLCSVLS